MLLSAAERIDAPAPARPEGSLTMLLQEFGKLQS